MNTRKYTALRAMALVFIGLIAVGTAHAADIGDSCGTAYLVASMPFAYFERLTPNDLDYYKIVVGSPGILTVYTDWYSGVDPEGTLLASNCTPIDTDQDSGSNNNFRIQRAVSAGTYYVQINAENSNTQGWYQFRATFTGDSPHTIEATAGTGGSITPPGSVSVPHGGNQTFSIDADACYVIDNVIVDSFSWGPQTSWAFTNVTSDGHTIHATFAQDGPFTVSATAETGGTITPSGAVAANCGDTPAFIITPDTGYEVLDVVVDGVGMGAVSNYTFDPIGQNATITARFKEVDKFTITTITGDNGSISPAGPIAVNQGASVTVQIIPDNGYVVDEVAVEGVSQGAVTSYTFPNVQSDQTIEARFKVDETVEPAGCIDISDTPLDALFRSAPPIVMFVLDDSGSMDWEVMTSETHSLFGDDEIPYIFDDPGDNYYSIHGTYGQILTGDQRKDWKSQWSGHNRMYYNPLIVYDPWPNLADANTIQPRSNPMVAVYTMKLADTYLTMTNTDTVVLDEKDPGFSVSTGWKPSSTYYGLAYENYYRSTTLEEVDKWARWSPGLPPGNYKVYARWADSGTNSSNVVFSVKDNGVWGDTTTVDQTWSGYSWQYIYTKWFDGDSYLEMFLDDDDAAVASMVADAVKFEPVDDSPLRINNAHYYTWHDADNDNELDSGEPVYLVNFVDDDNNGVIDGRDYYLVNDDGDDRLQRTELTHRPESTVPEEIRPKLWADDLQNFANWYTYYRRRSLSATAAIAGVIDQSSNMMIGIHSINGSISEPVYKIDVDGVDERDTLLTKLYSATPGGGGTPLRKGLLHVGMYLDKTDTTTDTVGIHTLESPYASADNGGACQQAFAVLMTDGYYNGEAPAVGDVDGDNGEPYADSWQNTLADIAMYYYENDLVDDSDLLNMVPTNERDTATHQHMVTYSVGFGVNGTLNPDDYDDDLKHTTTGDFVVWPNPDSIGEFADKNKIDDMWHASVNGRGRFLTSSDPAELLNSLLMVLKDIEYYAGSASSVSVNGDELYTQINNDVRLFQSKYYSENWHGDLMAYKVNQTTGAVVTPAVWSAAKQLNLKRPDDRLIAFTNNKGQAKTFQWKSLNKTMKQLLDPDDDRAEKMLDYIRGDATNEITGTGGLFRSRKWRVNDSHHPLSGQTIISSKLGDMVHSSPVYDRGALYTGANDGMMHAFDAETGDEIFAYIPYLVFENLKHLTDPDYSHRYFVDLTPTVAQVAVDGMTHLLVGGLGKGGKGYYALDISNVDPKQNQVPGRETDVKNMIKWEFPNSKTGDEDRDHVGYSFSRVTVAKSHDTSDAPWIVIFGNGYVSTSEEASLFILNPANGKVLKRIDTQVTGCNGLSTPMAVDVDYDGVVDYVYAGDLKGNMWKFDLTSTDYNDWEVAFYESDGLTPKPLFSTPGQPITTRPDVMMHCSIYRHGYLVFFGTGKYLEATDLTDGSLQSLYGIWDYGDDGDDLETAGDWDGAALTNSHLLQVPGVSLEVQTVTEYAAGSRSFRVTSSNKPDYSLSSLSIGGQCGDFGGSTACDLDGQGNSPDALPDPLKRVGWVMDLPGNGERIVSDVLVRSGNLLVISYIPEGSLCGTGGSSWLMQLKACTGANLGSLLYDLNDDGNILSDDKISTVDGQTAVPSGISFEGRLQPPAIILLGNGKEMLYLSSSKGTIETQRQLSTNLGLVYWRIFRPN